MASKSSGMLPLPIMGAMEFADVVRRRRMIRNYTDDPVDPAIVDRALAHAVRAPSAGFSQGWGFLVLDTPDDVRRYWAATADDLDHPDEWLQGMMRAPVVIVPCSSKAAYLGRYAEPDKGWTDRDEARWPVPFWHMDAAMASLLILLRRRSTRGSAAASSASRPRRSAAARAEFAIPDAFDPVGAITLGHPAPRPAHRGPPAVGDARTPTRSCTAARGASPADMEPVHPIHGAGAT